MKFNNSCLNNWTLSLINCSKFSRVNKREKSISSERESTLIWASLFTVKVFLAFDIGVKSLNLILLFLLISIPLSLLNLSQQYLYIASSKSLPPKKGIVEVSNTVKRLYSNLERTKVILECGKVNDNIFIMDFSTPLSPLEAFGISISYLT